MKSPPETVKPFKLVKYFFLSSFVVVLLFALTLSILITQRSEEALLKKTESFALLLAENLNHQVFFQFVVPVTFATGQVQLRNPDQFERLDKIIRNTIYNFKIQKVNIYDPRGVLAYSTDRTLVGKKDQGGTDYLKAMKGKYSSRFISEDVFLEIWPREKPPSRKLVTTIPFQVESPTGARTGQILGVFEITQDISEDYRDILRDQYLPDPDFHRLDRPAFCDTALYRQAGRDDHEKARGGTEEAGGATASGRADGQPGGHDRLRFP